MAYIKKTDGPCEPTSRDIRRACKDIRAGWSERERDKRAGRLRAVIWEVPEVDWDALAEAVNEDVEYGGQQAGYDS